MQISMTITLTDPSEAGIFFAELAQTFERAKSALSALLTPAPKTDNPALSRYEATRVSTAAAQETTAAPEASEQAPAENPFNDVSRGKGRGRGKSKAAEVAEAVASGGMTRVTEPAPAKKTELEDVSAALFTEVPAMLNRIITRGGKKGGAAHLHRLFSSYGVKKFTELKKEDQPAVYKKLRELDVDDAIPF